MEECKEGEHVIYAVGVRELQMLSEEQYLGDSVPERREEDFVMQTIGWVCRMRMLWQVRTRGGRLHKGRNGITWRIFPLSDCGCVLCDRKHVRCSGELAEYKT